MSPHYCLQTFTPMIVLLHKTFYVLYETQSFHSAASGYTIMINSFNGRYCLRSQHFRMRTYFIVCTKVLVTMAFFNLIHEHESIYMKEEKQT